ncbi:MAG: acyltransferase [Bacteroidetes bacterium]|nr:acyltransferase [Bacteroidota bacterium]
MAVKRKEQSIETIRGIAIILMVAGHVIGNRSDTGLMVEDHSLWRYIYHSFEYLRMPLFTAISGFVYALKPVSSDAVFKFLKGKSRRILLPFFFVSTLQYSLNAIIPSVNNRMELSEIWKIYIYAYGQFWFLQALFFVFITVVILEVNNFLNNLKYWLISLASAILILVFAAPFVMTTFLSFTSYLYLLPFFLLGIGINRFSGLLFRKLNIIIVFILLLAGLAMQQLNLFGLIELQDAKYGMPGTFIGLTGIFLIFYIRKPNRFLAELGYYSYGIYLFHVFGTAGSRIISKWLGIHNLLPLFVIGLIFGLGLPVVLELILLKNAVLRRLFLGLK